MKVEHIPCGPFANDSERTALETLIQKLTPQPMPQHWLLLSNLPHSVNTAGIPDEIDLVAIGSTGVHIIEIKHWDRAFLKGRTNIVKQEAVKLNDKVKRVVSKLRRACPDLPFLAGKFLLTKETRPLGDANRPVYQGAKCYSLGEWKQMLCIEGAVTCDSAAIHRTCQVIEPRTKVQLTGSLRRLAAIGNMELVSAAAERFHRIYKGRHVIHRDRVIVHLYDLSASNSADAMRIASREFEIVQRFQKEPWSPRLMDSFQEVPNYPGELYYFSIVDPVAPTVAERSLDAE